MFKHDVQSPQWATTSAGPTWLITRNDGNGIAFQDDRKVILLSSEGKFERSIAIPSGYTPLAINEDGKLESYPGLWLQESDANASNPKHGPSWFAQGSSRFLITRGITVIGNHPAHSFSDYDRYGGIGIDQSGTVLAEFTSASLQPVIRVSSLVDSEWVDRQRLIAANISHAGTAAPIAGYNDLVFLDKNHICFLGWIQTRGFGDLKEYEDWLGKINDYRKWPIADQRSRNKSECFLVVTRLSDGYSYAAGRFAAEANHELRGPTTGRIAASKDQSCLFVRAEGSILRFESKALLKFFGG